MENFMEYIKPELLVLLPVLWFMGAGFKHSQIIKDKHIPLLLGLSGILLAGVWVLATSQLAGWQDVLLAAFTAATQGILAAGMSVYVSQLIKQAGRKE